MKINLKDLDKHYNEDITIQGFVDNIRNLQYVIFMIIKDETGKVQVTLEKETTDKQLLDIVENLTLESTVKITGKLLENEKVKLNKMELIPTNIEVTSTSLSELPIDIKDKDKTLRETRLDYRFLDLRREENYLMFEIVTYMQFKMREYWVNNNYIEIHTPKINKAAAESGAEMFKLDYFGQKANLAQSPQFYKQMVMASNFNKAFEISQVFRAENSHTSYHETEIVMVDAEISWINDYTEVMDEEERWIKYFMKAIKEKYADIIKEKFNVEVSNVDNDFPRIDFYECKKILKDKYNYVGQKEDDLERSEEELICKYAKENYGSDFVFITNFPYTSRSFYVMCDKDKTKTFDLLYKGVEITSGAQREHRIEVLEKQVEEKGLTKEQLSFYLDFFKYGMPPHGGFGFGLNRLIMKIFELESIREASLIYRGPTRLNP